ncbi:MAG TPA: hypothetical protein VF142_19710 [Longimicrobium sp.]
MHLLGAVLLVQPVASQPAPSASEPASVLAAVMHHRLYWMEDRTPFDACSLQAHAGSAAAFPGDLPADLQALVLDVAPAASGGCSDRAAVARALPPRVVRVESVTFTDSVAQVRLLVQKGDHAHREDHSVRRTPLGAWDVAEMRMWGHLYTHPSRP